MVDPGTIKLVCVFNRLESEDCTLGSLNIQNEGSLYVKFINPGELRPTIELMYTLSSATSLSISERPPSVCQSISEVAALNLIKD